LKYVPYDNTISPTDNLYDNPNDLDYQPDYPLRTDLKYYERVEQVYEAPFSSKISIDSGEQGPLMRAGGTEAVDAKLAVLILVFTVLTVWYFCFMKSGSKQRDGRIRPIGSTLYKNC
jgi:hypothetical protein